MQRKQAVGLFFGTVFGLIVFVAIMLALHIKLDQLLYICLIILLLISLIISDQYFPKTWFRSFVLGFVVILFHISIKSWLLTALLLVLSILYLLFNFYQKEVLRLLALGFVYMIVIVGFFFLAGGERPTISEDVIHYTFDEMKRYDGILNVSIEVDESVISCTLEVDKKLSEKERKKYGETCAKTLATKISEQKNLKGPEGSYLGEVYDYYTLELVIKTDREAEEPLYIRKSTGQEEFSW